MSRCWARVLAGTGLLLGLGSCTSKQEALRNQTVLQVNSISFSTQEFADRLALKLRNFDALQVKDESNLQRAKEDVLQTLVLEGLTRQYAADKKIRISDADLDMEIQKIRNTYPDELAFKKALSDEKTSFASWRRNLEISFLQKKVANQLANALPEPTDAELKEDYEGNKAQYNSPARVRLKQIVVDKEDSARRLLAELAKGTDISSLAKQYSIAPEADRGGDTGWIDKGTLEVFDQAFKMKPGSRSKIIKSPYGFHIYELVQRENESHLSFNEAKAKIRALLLEQREQKAFSAWLEEQVRKAKVLRNDEMIRAIQVSTRGN